MWDGENEKKKYIRFFRFSSLGQFSVHLFPLFVLSGKLCLLSVKPTIQSSFFDLVAWISYSCMRF